MARIVLKTVNKEWLEKFYYAEGCNLSSAGLILGIEKRTLWAWLKRHGYPTKAQSDAQSGSLNGFFGKSHEDKTRSKIGKASKERQDRVQRGAHGRYGDDGRHPEGPANPTFKTGISTYRRRTLRARGTKCERCGVAAYGRNIHVHHKDRDRKNNEPDNLEVVCWDCHKKEHPEDGESNPAAKLTPDQVAEIRHIFAASTHRYFWGATKLAQKFNVSVSTVNRIAHNELW